MGSSAYVVEFFRGSTVVKRGIFSEPNPTLLPVQRHSAQGNPELILYDTRILYEIHRNNFNDSYNEAFRLYGHLVID
jgi:hypothetical protein